jgi:Secretion system C-terminal sorting domain/PKD domain
MPLYLRCCLLLFLGLLGHRSFAQTPADYAVQVSAVVQASPPQIRLHWPQDPAATGYTISRKAMNASGWSPVIGTLAATDTAFTDTAVVVGETWEYRISKTASGYSGQGYCFASIARPTQDYFGKLLLVIDTTYAAALAPEIKRLEWDLWGDGWQVIRLDVDRNDSVTGIHDRIQAAWMADPVHVRSVFLLGHVPVPYSGELNPDGHGDHIGAWPADVYYGEMDGTWSDNIVNNISAARPANQNIPGDRKFDETALPSDVDLEVGRVDFANMPSFAVGEEGLLRRYLDKDHAWRTKAFTVADSAVVDDNFGAFGGEAFAKSGWRNFAPLVGASHVYAGDFRTDLSARDHLWAYGCGGGWYQGASGVGATSDFAGDSLRGVFTMIFGSYHGDWDSDDNFMRAALASRGHILSCAWAGRPNWHFQHMGLGEPIGYAAKITQNNSFLYVGGFGTRYVHIALMGDPSLRLHVCAPPTALAVTLVNGGNSHELDWGPSPDPVLSYAIYRQDSAASRFWRIATVGAGVVTYTDSCVAPGNYRYMVRAEELRTGYSGSYYNLSEGAIDSIANTAVYAIQADTFAPVTYCAGDTVIVPYTTVSDFCSDNIFSVEMSDSNGSFVSPILVGQANATATGTVTCVIPQGTIAATGYRLRIDGGHPQVIGIDSGTDLEVLNMPVASFSNTQAGSTVTLTSTSSGATSYFWDFGDGFTSTLVSATHAYNGPATFLAQLIASNACGSDTASAYFILDNNADEDPFAQFVSIAPNPAHTWFEVSSRNLDHRIQSIQIYDLLGHLLMTESWNGTAPLRIETSDWSSGVYIVEISAKQGVTRKKIMVE